MCGLPSSGKTRRVGELIAYFSQNHSERLISVVTEENEGVFSFKSKSVVYNDAKEEKEARATLKAAVLRLLSKDGVVILDSLNYIKGYRYELYCASKSAHTTHCVIFCDTNLDIIRQWNGLRTETDQYEPEVLEALAVRFELPNGNNRWDKPLFSLQVGDPLPGADVAAAIFHRKPPPPNLSTLTQPLEASDFLFLLDKKTQEVVKEVFQGQQGACHGDPVLISDSSESFLVKSRTLPLAELRKWRQQFITYSKLHPPENSDRIPTLFVQYLNNAIAWKIRFETHQW